MTFPSGYVKKKKIMKYHKGRYKGSIDVFLILLWMIPNKNEKQRYIIQEVSRLTEENLC